MILAAKYLHQNMLRLFENFVMKNSTGWVRLLEISNKVQSLLVYSILKIMDI